MSSQFLIKKWRSIEGHFFMVSILGFISGLPFSLLGTTLAAWFASRDVSIVSIGLLSLVHQPYALKFLWAPLLDMSLFKGLGRRRGWLVGCQILLCCGIVALSYLDPQQHSCYIALLALLLAFISATQDIAIDAYRAELLAPKERGLGATIAIFSYRVATFVSGALALIIADYYGWQFSFIFIALLIIPCCLLIFLFKEPEPLSSNSTRLNWLAAIKSLFSNKYAFKVVVFIFLFKLGEAFTSTSSTIIMPFLIQGLGFSLTVVGSINKGVGVIATLLGSVCAGAMLLRFSLYYCLLLFAFLQVVMNSLFILLSLVGKHYALLVVCIFGDNVVAGMGMTALIAFMMGSSNKQYTATQFAFFSAISALPRLIAGPIGAFLQLYFGWTQLFILSVIFAMPVLLSISQIKNQIIRIEN